MNHNNQEQNVINEYINDKIIVSNKNFYCSNCNKRNGKPNRRNLGSIINSDIERICSRCKNVFMIEEFIKAYGEGAVYYRFNS